MSAIEPINELKKKNIQLCERWSLLNDTSEKEKEPIILPEIFAGREELEEGCLPFKLRWKGHSYTFSLLIRQPEICFGGD